MRKIEKPRRRRGKSILVTITAVGFSVDSGCQVPIQFDAKIDSHKYNANLDLREIIPAQFAAARLEPLLSSRVIISRKDGLKSQTVTMELCGRFPMFTR